jgi:outer membrane protein TolC
MVAVMKAWRSNVKKKGVCAGVLLAIACLPGLLLLSGCLGPGSQRSEPRATSLGERILLRDREEPPSSEATSGSIGLLASLPFRPITLDEAVEIALANNPSLKISAKDVVIAGENVGVARSAFFPQASFTYGYDRRSKPPGMKVPSSTILPPGPGVPPTLSIVAGEKEFQRAELKAYMTLWDFGRTLGTYREQAEAHLKTATSFAREGLVDRNDVLQAELQAAEVTQAVIRADHAVELATSVFNNVLGIRVNRKTEVVDVTEALPTAIELREALELAVANRPEFKVIQKSIEVQKQGLAVAKAGFLPRIYVAGGYNRLDDDFQLNKDYWAGEVGIQLDLFTGGRRLAETRLARWEVQKSEEQAREMCDAIALQVKSGVLGIADAKGRLGVAEQAVAQAEENLRLMNNKYREHLASSTDVIDAETALARARINYYAAIYDYNTARARLQSAVGRELTGIAKTVSTDNRPSAESPSPNTQKGE